MHSIFMNNVGYAKIYQNAERWKILYEILNFPIKREQSQTCLSYAEREESQRS